MTLLTGFHPGYKMSGCRGFLRAEASFDTQCMYDNMSEEQSGKGLGRI